MPEETLSFFGSTIGFVKPVAYDLIDVPVIWDNKVRKIMHDAPITFLTSIVQWCKDHLCAPWCCHGSAVMDGWL